MLSTLQSLGILPSFSRPSVSDDNPYSEALFRTLKYCPSYPSNRFKNIEAARAWVHRFVNWYNEDHRHSGIQFVTPKARHQGDDVALLANRQAVYEEAKTKHPERWKGRGTRNWAHATEVWLNPPKEKQKEHQKMQDSA